MGQGNRALTLLVAPAVNSFGCGVPSGSKESLYPRHLSVDRSHEHHLYLSYPGVSERGNSQTLRSKNLLQGHMAGKQQLTLNMGCLPICGHLGGWLALMGHLGRARQGARTWCVGDCFQNSWHTGKVAYQNTESDLQAREVSSAHICASRTGGVLLLQATKQPMY